MFGCMMMAIILNKAKLLSVKKYITLKSILNIIFFVVQAIVPFNLEKDKFDV